MAHDIIPTGFLSSLLTKSVRILYLLYRVRFYTRGKCAPDGDSDLLFALPVKITGTQ